MHNKFTNNQRDKKKTWHSLPILIEEQNIGIFLEMDV